jgi:hypothetical protein
MVADQIISLVDRFQGQLEADDLDEDAHLSKEVDQDDSFFRQACSFIANTHAYVT